VGFNSSSRRVFYFRFYGNSVRRVIVHIVLRALVFTAMFFGIGFGLRFVINSFFPELLYGSESGEIYGQGYEQAPVPGSRVNITMDNTGEYAVPELFRSQDSDKLGNIEDLISGTFITRPDNASRQPSHENGIDDNEKESYNNKGESHGFSLGLPQELSFLDGDFFEGSSVDTQPEKSPAAEKPQFTPSFGDDAGLGGLPDLDMMARAFSSSYTSSEQAPAAVPAGLGGSSFTAPISAPVFEETQPQTRYRGGNRPEPLKGDFNARELAKGLSAVLSKDK